MEPGEFFGFFIFVVEWERGGVEKHGRDGIRFGAQVHERKSTSAKPRQLLRDAFAGGFVAGIVEGKSLDECVDMGHWLASLSIKELGPQYVIPTPLNDLPSCPQPHQEFTRKTLEKYQHNLFTSSRPLSLRSTQIRSFFLSFFRRLIFEIPTHRYPSPKQTYKPTSKP